VLALVVVLSSMAAEPCQLIATSPALSRPWQVAAADAGCIDAAATLEPTHEGAVLSVTTRDGRNATRTITTPSEISAIITGLLATIPPEPPVAPPSEPERVRTSEPAPTPTSAPVITAEKRELANVAATFGTRIGLPTGVVSTELELRGDVLVGPWAFALSGRSAPTGTRFAKSRGPDWEYTDFSIGALGGRWVKLGSGVLTVSGGPRYGVVARDTETTTSKRKDVWFQAGARYVFAVGDRWRPCLSSDLEGAVTRLVTNASAFPAWAGSLRIGVVGSVP
jgi:hypothetical protein